MRALAFAWRGMVRQPARAALGILGVAAVGALLFDMLLLSRGLVLSMRDLLDRVGFDIRVTATASLPGSGPAVSDADAVAARLMALPEVSEVVPIRTAQATADPPDGRRELPLVFFGADPSRRRAWTVTTGQDLPRTDGPTGAILINEHLASLLSVAAGESLTLRPSCGARRAALPPVTFRVAGVARFPFDIVNQSTAATSLDDVAEACGGEAPDSADLILVASAEQVDAERAREAIARALPGYHVLTNAQVVGRLEQAGFSYFRQISAVLSTVTLGFGLLLITVLLTVSVNQRLGLIAALRALGFSRRRMVADILCESALFVGIGGILALPLGAALAVWLDRILKGMPGIPAELHFFVFEPRALAVHAALLVVTALLAAIYPIRLVARLPIAATLRNEVVS